MCFTLNTFKNQICGNFYENHHFSILIVFSVKHFVKQFCFAVAKSSLSGFAEFNQLIRQCGKK
jgi:hypothetical protein